MIGSQQPDPILLLIGFALLVLITLLIREVLCWYWKLNNIVALLERKPACQAAVG